MTPTDIKPIEPAIETALARAAEELAEAVAALRRIELLLQFIGSTLAAK